MNRWQSHCYTRPPPRCLSTLHTMCCMAVHAAVHPALTVLHTMCCMAVRAPESC
jgi:hypothetical protein